MEHSEYSDNEIGFLAKSSRFETAAGVSECHLMIEPLDKCLSIEKTLSVLDDGLRVILDSEEMDGYKVVFKRFFLSDIVAQRRLISTSGDAAVSVIQQPPLDGSKAVVWVWLMKGDGLSVDDGIVKSDKYTYRFDTLFTSNKMDSQHQMAQIFQEYNELLRHKHMSVERNCQRTWIFVRDVDVNYGGVVRARKELFEEWGLTNNTHYIASTGINGVCEKHENLVMMDAYAVDGLQEKDIQYLYAYDNLSPTSLYGVTFERGTALHLDGRKQIFISGTASIDSRGAIVATGDIDGQIERMMENVDALLSEAEADESDIAQMIVYIRDIADYDTVKDIFDRRLPDVPMVITWAPVCRPGWLIEVECIAYK